MDPSGVPALLQGIADRAAKASAPAVLALANTYEDYVRNVELLRYGHAPHTRTPSPPYTGSPAIITGELRNSVIISGVQLAPVVSRAAVAPHTIYAAVQEWGADLWPSRAKYLSWVTNGRRYYKRHVHVPERPYMRPATRACITSGRFGREAARAFEKAVWG